MNEQVFKQMLEVYSYQLDVARESEERVKALRHDIKHHIIELSAMAKNNNDDDMIKYFKRHERIYAQSKGIFKHRKPGNRRGVELYVAESKQDAEAGRCADKYSGRSVFE
mgnify:CR=1 FL=1